METTASVMIDVKLVAAVIGPLVAGIIFLALYIKSIHETHSKEQKENLVTMTTAIVTNTQVIENNTKMVEKIFEKMK